MEIQREIDPCDRDVSRSNVRSAMRAASQLPRGKPTDVDGAPAPASLIHLNAMMMTMNMQMR